MTRINCATSKFICLCTLMFAGLAANMLATENCISYTNFLNIEGLSLVPGALQTNGVVQLTASQADQNGALWLTQKQNCSNGFSTSFQFQMSQIGDLGGGDGIGFCVQNGGLQTQGSEYGAITNKAFGVSFNTFHNSNEPSDNFVGITVNPLSPEPDYLLTCDLAPFNIFLKDGNPHHAEIDYDGTTISVLLDQKLIITNFPVSIAIGLDENSAGWVGLGARTGWGFEKQDILSWSFCAQAASPVISPSISQQPENQTVAPGATATFSVVADGTAPLHYQWRLNGTNISGANDLSLVLTNVQQSDVGLYSVRITNSGGAIESSNAVLAIIPPSVAGCFGFTNFSSADGLTFVGSASNVDDVLLLTPSAENQVGAAWLTEKQFCANGFVSSFRFRISDIHSAGGDGFSFSIQNSGTSAPGSEYGSQSSNSFGISFNTYQNENEPSDNFIGVVTNTVLYTPQYFAAADLYSFGINLSDSIEHLAVIRYSGSALDVEIDGQIIISNLVVSIAAGLDQNGYGWIGFGGRTGGSTETHEITEWSFCTTATNIEVAPEITLQPSDKSVTAGGNVGFTVTANGSFPLTYQWAFNGTNILSATNSVLALTNIQPAQQGSYSVLVSNNVGSVVSSNAVLTVLLPPANVRVVSTTAMAGSPISLPVVLVANGNENALSFSLTFPSQLTFTGVELGTDAQDAFVLLNTTETNSGRVGIALALNTGETFSQGTKEIVRVHFASRTTTSTSPSNLPIDFADMPVTRQLSDTEAQKLSATYSGGTITLTPTQFEADAAPRPNGDRNVSITDWVQVGRFAAGLDTPAAGGEFQRADCAPKSDLGDGKIKVTDWVQAGRYAAGLDPLSAVGGPTDSDGNSARAAGKTFSIDSTTAREVRFKDVSAIQGVVVNLPITLQAQGDENALGFSVEFDPANFTFIGLTRGGAASGASFNVNSNSAASGEIGVVLALPAGATFPAGSDEVARISFLPRTAGNLSIDFTDEPVLRVVSDAAAEEVTASFSRATITGNPLPSLKISNSESNTVVSWPNWAAGFVLQSLEATNFNAGDWTNLVANPQTNGSEISVTVPKADAQFYRLQHP